MTDRIKTLVKRISETRPVQTARREALLSDLRALRRDIDERSAPEQVRSLDAALLLMEFMSRSEDVATAETLTIVATLVGTVNEHLLRRPSAQAQPSGQAQSSPPTSSSHPHLSALAGGDFTQHQDLRMTHEFLLGSILLQASVISPDSLARALQLHSSSGMALGQCLIQLGAASPEQIAGAVAYQDRLRDEERATRPEPERPAPKSLDLRLSPKQKGFVQSMHAQVLGEVMIRLGSITREQLERALQLQRAANVHIGEALVQSGATSWEQIKRALDVQRQLRRSAA
jgi:hypothetical protein